MSTRQTMTVKGLNHQPATVFPPKGVQHNSRYIRRCKTPACRNQASTGPSFLGFCMRHYAQWRQEQQTKSRKQEQAA